MYVFPVCNTPELLLSCIIELKIKKRVLQLLHNFCLMVLLTPTHEYSPLNFNTFLIECMEFQCLARKN